jgi:hypothetical protein
LTKFNSMINLFRANLRRAKRTLRWYYGNSSLAKRLYIN